MPGAEATAEAGVRSTKRVPSGQSAPCNFRSTTPWRPSCPAGAAFRALYNLRRHTQPGAAFQRGSSSSAAGRTGASPRCSPQSRGRRHHHGPRFPAALPGRLPPPDEAVQGADRPPFEKDVERNDLFKCNGRYLSLIYPWLFALVQVGAVWDGWQI